MIVTAAERVLHRRVVRGRPREPAGVDTDAVLDLEIGRATPRVAKRHGARDLPRGAPPCGERTAVRGGEPGLEVLERVEEEAA